jgi:hypothetical protein
MFKIETEFFVVVAPRGGFAIHCILHGYTRMACNLPCIKRTIDCVQNAISLAFRLVMAIWPILDARTKIAHYA